MATCTDVEEVQKPEPLSKRNAEIFFDGAYVFIISIEGVLWDKDGLIDGSLQTVLDIRATGKRIFYVTNDSEKTRKEVTSKLNELGFPAEEKDVINSTFVVTQFLKKANFKDKVFIVGNEKAIGAEMTEAGIDNVGAGEQVQARDPAACLDVELDPDVKCVFVGYDPNINFTKIMKAVSYLKNPECLYLSGTNCAVKPAKDSEIVIPDVGCITAAIGHTVHREPFVAGMPCQNLFHYLRKEHEIKAHKTVVIGSALNTDIGFARSCGMKSLLLLSGQTEENDFMSPAANPLTQPNYFGINLQEFGEYLF